MHIQYKLYFSSSPLTRLPANRRNRSIVSSFLASVSRTALSYSINYSSCYFYISYNLERYSSSMSLYLSSAFCILLRASCSIFFQLWDRYSNSYSVFILESWATSRWTVDDYWQVAFYCQSNQILFINDSLSYTSLSYLSFSYQSYFLKDSFSFLVSLIKSSTFYSETVSSSLSPSSLVINRRQSDSTNPSSSFCFRSALSSLSCKILLNSLRAALRYSFCSARCDCSSLVRPSCANIFQNCFMELFSISSMELSVSARMVLIGSSRDSVCPGPCVAKRRGRAGCLDCGGLRCECSGGGATLLFYLPLDRLVGQTTLCSVLTLFTFLVLRGWGQGWGWGRLERLWSSEFQVFLR